MFYDFPIQYHQPVFRPPSEANSLLIQVTLGCSNNLCTYCDMYRSKKYKVRNIEDIKKDIDLAKQYFDKVGHAPKRIFLCDGDALGAPMNILEQVLTYINEAFPYIDRVGIYATAQNILEKTDEELNTLNKLKLKIAYLGLESGSDKVLHFTVKGNNQSDMITASNKIKNAGFKLSTIAMLGLGGRKFNQDHIVETAKVLTQTAPDYFSFLTTFALKGTPYYKLVDRGTVEILTTKELLTQMYQILDLTKNTTPILLRVNHVSNQYPIGGTLPQDRDMILNTIESWINNTNEGEYPPTPQTM